MHRDVKVGLVLGVALVAVVAALFFREEPTAPDLSEPSAAPLQDAAALDEQVATLPGAPYPMDSAAGGSHSTRAEPGPRTLTPEPSRGAPPSPSDLRPLARAADAPDALPRPIVVDPAGPAAPDAATGELPGAEPTPRTHVVQAGDTLYDLAEHYLGRGERFGEIFEANRDVLDRPDRLPLGAELVIPAAEPELRSGEPTVVRGGQSVRRPRGPARARPASPPVSADQPPVPDSQARLAAPERDPAPGPAAGADEPTPTARSGAGETASGTDRTFGEVAAPRAERIGPRPATEAATGAGAPEQAGTAGSPSNPAAPRSDRLYTVRPGDTLIGIAIREYGDPQLYYRIYEANRDTLPSPDHIREGMVLRLP